MAREPGRIRAFNPRRTLAVSVTGRGCALRCRHCGGRYLKGMADLGRARRLLLGPPWPRPFRPVRFWSLLVSGGSDLSGRVPLADHLGDLEVFRALGLRLNLHTGLVGPEEAAGLGPLASAVSLDFVGSAEVAREVYGLNAGPRESIAALRALKPFARVVPHLCLGLKGGEPSAEEEALELLSCEGVEALVLLVFTPTPGTDYSGRLPPPLPRVEALFRLARELLPRAAVYLGCMRPGGGYRRELDRAAVRAGLDGVVLPAAEALEEALALGLEVSWGEECCAL
ncbi:MAG: hypothetical protein K6T75_00220 [Acetobacteraceae bacterium]|nr:hypothetical protein [Acetobacteraceae bacterium]